MTLDGFERIKYLKRLQIVKLEEVPYDFIYKHNEWMSKLLSLPSMSRLYIEGEMP